MSNQVSVQTAPAPTKIAGNPRRGLAGARKELGIFGLLVLVCVITYMRNHVFFSAVNVGDLAMLIGIYGIYGIGAGVVIATGGIDLTVGSVFALEGVLVALALNTWQFHGHPWNPIFTVFAALAFTMTLGLIHGLLITKIPLQPFVVTLCGLLIYRGLARIITGDSTVGFGDGTGYTGLMNLATGSTFLGIGHSGLLVPNTLLIMIVIAVIMWVVLHRSVYGRYLFAVGRNEEAARYSGINSHKIIITAYVIAGLLTGISGILFAFYTNDISPSSHGTSYELYGIAAAVLGGCSLRGGEGSVIGILIGTALLQVLQNLVNILGIPSSLDPAVVGSVILIGVTFDEIVKRRSIRMAAKS